MEQTREPIKKQLWIFIAIAYALPFALGLLMWYGYNNSIDVSVFPTAQMHYPAVGAMLAALLTRKGDALIPKRFFIGFTVLTFILMLFSVASIFIPMSVPDTLSGIGYSPWNLYSQFLLMAGSAVLLVILMTEKKEKRLAYGLRGGRWHSVALVTLIFLVLYFARFLIALLVAGQSQQFFETMSNPDTWINFAILIGNYFFVFSAFFGEEYGWRYFLQPILQKKYGMKLGIIILGIVWGLWHLPINFFYYTSPSMGLMSLASQFITCTALGIFFGWAYLKTDNIWTLVILHFINNNLVPIISGNYSADVLQNQEFTWGAVLFSLILNGILFFGFIFSPYFKDISRRLPTMSERADAINTQAEEISEPKEL